MISPSEREEAKERFAKLSEGLEVSVVSLAELICDNEKWRLDSEFFKKEYVGAYRKIKSKKHTQLKDIISTLSDFHSNGSYESIAEVFELLDKEDYAYMVRTTDLEKGDYETDVKYITKKCYEYLAKSKLYGGELLINKIGSPGRMFIMPNLNRPVSLGMNLFMIRVKKDSGYNEAFLWAFFNTKLGKSIVERKINGTVPLTIDKEAIRSLYIPLLPPSFQSHIESLVRTAHEKLQASRTLYTTAESLLLEALGLKDFKVSSPSISFTAKDGATKTYRVNASVRKFSFAQSVGRMDAEYYQEKYEEVEERIKAFSGGWKRLGEVATLHDKNITPSKEMQKYIELANIGSQGEITGCTKDTGENLPSRARRIVHTENVIVSSIEGSLQSCAIIPSEYNGAFCSTGFFVFEAKDIKPQVLLLLLKSPPFQLLLKQACSGTILTAFNSTSLLSLPIPLLPLPIQKQIADDLQQSAALRKQSKELLERAKREVEREIEKA